MAVTPSPGGLGRFLPDQRLVRGRLRPPTQAQVGAWDALAQDRDVLVVAPTGSGKTLAAFLSAIDRLATAPGARAPAPPGPVRLAAQGPCRRHRAQPAPLAGLRAAAAGQDLPLPDITVGMRTGDTPAEARRRFPAHPPDILITTPESLFLLLTSRAREALAHIDTVIVDEVHSVVRPSAAPTWRSAWSAWTSCWSGRPAASACRRPSGPWTRWPASSAVPGR